MNPWDELQKQAHEFNSKVGLPEHWDMKFVKSELNARANKLMEEAMEFSHAFRDENKADLVDSLVDIMYVCVGFLNQMGVRIQPIHDGIHAANMKKVSADGYEVTKLPPDEHPNIGKLLLTQKCGGTNYDRIFKS